MGGFERGLATSAMIVPGLIAVAFVGKRSDALFRRSPPKCLVFIGGLIASFGIFTAVGIFMPNLAPLLILMGIGDAMASAAFAIVIAPISSIIPYRLRSRGVAMIGLYIFLFGAFFGSVVTGLLADEIGRRGAVAVVVVPAALIGGALIAYGARYVRQDVALVVEELEEERDENRRLQQHGADSPVIQVRNLDFSYGKVQVLFDVSLDVYKGETLALLGTNGAGKSTLLRVVSGLGVPQRGVVRFNGRTVTFADAELRVKIGIVQLMGGTAIFPPLTVEENLRMGGFLYSGKDLERRIDRVCGLLPVVRERWKSKAGDLSGGEQQMVALAMTLLHEPEVLIIDELSLGLAPLVVQRLLEVVRELQAQGMTMIIVEQSLNVALVDRRPRRLHGEGRGEVRGRRERVARARRPRPRRVPLQGRGMISSAVTLALEFPRQSIFSGVMQGLTYGVIAIGLILIYRSTQIINFAIVEMGAFAAALLARLVINWGVDYWVALPACVIAGGLLGAGVELVIVRRLFRSPRVVLFVATIGLAQLLLFFQFVLPKFDTYGAFPTAFSFTWEFQGLFIRSEHVLVLVIVPLLAIVLTIFLNHTKYGHGDPRVGRQPRRGAPLVDQSQEDVDARVDDRRIARGPGHDPHDPAHQFNRDRDDHVGSRRAVARDRRRAHRRHGVDAACRAGWRRHRHRRGAALLQLPRARSACSTACSSSRCS